MGPYVSRLAVCHAGDGVRGGPGEARRQPVPAPSSRVGGCRRRPRRWRRWSPPRRVVGARTVGPLRRSRHRSSVLHRRSGARGSESDGPGREAVGRWTRDQPVVRVTRSRGCVCSRGTSRPLADRTSRGVPCRSASSRRKHFTPLAVRPSCAGDPRRLPLDAFAKPLRLTFEELGTTFMKFGQLVASSPGVFGDEVSGQFRSCLDTGPVVQFELVRRVVEARPRHVAGGCVRAIRPDARSAGLDRRRAPGPPLRRDRGGGEGAPARHREAGLDRHGPVRAAARVRRTHDRRVRGGSAARDVRQLPPAAR